MGPALPQAATQKAASAPAGAASASTRPLTRLLSAPSRSARIATGIAVAFLMAAMAWTLFLNGGVRYAFVHTFYLPIIVAALVFGTRGGIAAGIFAGLLVGPYMPLDASGALQSSQNWVFRLLIFALVGALTGYSAGILRRQLRRMAWLQEHDALTGLLNQDGLLRGLKDIIDSGEQPKLVVAVTHLRNLLEIESTFGPDFLEQLLPQIVERKRANLPPGSLIAMIQNDRFATVITQLDTLEQVRRGVEEQVQESYMVNGIPVHLDFSVGSAHYPEHATEPLELLKKAIIAMQWAMTHNVLIAVYDNANDHTSHDNMVLLGSLGAALAGQEMRLWHQAKCRLSDRRIAGTEALLRWVHPERGMVPPGSFIPQVEETALINPLTRWVIDAAMADAAALRGLGHALDVSINLSVRNLRDPALIGLLSGRAAELSLSPSNIELEITESAVMDDIGYCSRLIAELRDTGFRVSIDDFGTGHSSLAYLKKLPVSALKIDQAFIKMLATDPYNQKIVQTILHMARVLDLKTIAEGVEDEQALALLSEWGCDYAQGFAIHRPAPCPDLVAWLEARPPSSEAALRRTG